MKLLISSVTFCLFIVSAQSESFHNEEVTESAIIDTESNKVESEVRSSPVGSVAAYITNFLKTNESPHEIKKRCSEGKKKPIKKPIRRWDPYYDPYYESNFESYYDAHRTPRPAPRRSTTFYESSYFFYKHYVEGRNLKLDDKDVVGKFWDW